MQCLNHCALINLEPMKTISALIAPPGAGKTTWLINQLNQNRDQRSIIAFPTKLLSAEVQRRLTDIHLKFNAIDGDTVDGSVIQCLEASLANKIDRIIICTHESLRLIKADVLHGWHLYIDEIPTTWDCDTLSFSELSYRVVLDSFAELDGDHSNRLKIKADCKQLIEELASQNDSAISCEARRLLKVLLDERHIVEVDELDINQVRTVRIVGVKDYIPAFEAANTTVIMGAEIEKTLLGVILKGAGWSTTSLDANLGFTGYGNKVIIHPFLSNKPYSKSTALIKGGKSNDNYEDGCLVDAWLKHDVFRIIGNRKAILVAHSWCKPELPTKENGQPINITRLKIDSRGINDYDDYSIAICLQHGNLNPIESSRSTPTLAGLLSLENTITSKDIIEAIKYERLYESTLQSVCRTALRSRDHEGEILLFVQDQYVAKFLYSKIGDCTIDESYSEVVIAPDSKAKITRDNLKQKAVALHEKGHNPRFIAAQIGKSDRTVRDWLKPYRQLKAMHES